MKIETIRFVVQYVMSLPSWWYDYESFKTIKGARQMRLVADQKYEKTRIIKRTTIEEVL